MPKPKVKTKKKQKVKAKATLLGLKIKPVKKPKVISANMWATVNNWGQIMEVYGNYGSATFSSPWGTKPIEVLVTPIPKEMNKKDKTLVEMLKEVGFPLTHPKS